MPGTPRSTVKDHVRDARTARGWLPRIAVGVPLWPVVFRPLVHVGSPGVNLEQAQQQIEHLKRASKALVDAQALWWAAQAAARADGSSVPISVRLELMSAMWQGREPGPEVSMMFEMLAAQLPDEGWWALCCSYGEYRRAVT